MIRSFRAAAIAAAAFLVATLTFNSQPMRAAQASLESVAAFQQAMLGSAASTPQSAAVSVAASVQSLAGLIAINAAVETESREQHCLASAIYFEARGEPLEGQLAVAEVVLNRMRSGRYPGSVCGVVTQPAQFSFVRRGVIPRANRDSEAWQRAVALARIAEDRLMRVLPEDVLWYPANYVSPGWGRRLERNTRIGLHIFDS